MRGGLNVAKCKLLLFASSRAEFLHMTECIRRGEEASGLQGVVKAIYAGSDEVLIQETAEALSR
jgi:hypothetical protein